MHNLNKTLAEQLHISTREIAKRKDLLGFTEKDAKTLLSFSPIIAKHSQYIVKDFYGFMTGFDEVATIIGDAETLRRLESSLNLYVIEMFGGLYDDDYVSKRLRVGLVHQRIGVSTDLYLSAMHQLQLNLNNTLAMYEIDGDVINDPFVLRQAVNKILMFDVQFVMDAYLSGLVNQVKTAEKELSEYAESLEIKVEERTRELADLSMRDMLTDIYNQRAFFEHLRRELATAERYRESLVLCYFDLNGFKKINDSKGHQKGDEILKLTGKLIQKSLRETDIGCRYGGDEFALILPRSTLDDADIVTKRLIENFKKEKIKGVSFSMGHAETGPINFVGYEQLLKAADKEMYKAKEKAIKRHGYYVSSVTVKS